MVIDPRCCTQMRAKHLCWLLVISARSIRPLSAPSHVSRRLPIPQMKSTIKMHSSDYPIIFKKGSRTLCMAHYPLDVYTLREIYHTWKGCAWIIEGDISDCFGAPSHDLLISV